MKMIVGLGNPDEKYKTTRHNTGFLFVDYAKNYFQPETAFSLEKKLDAEICTLTVNQESWVIVKPQTYMNNSGLAVAKCLKLYPLDLHRDLFIAHDDLDIVFGSWKIQLGKGPKVHNGLISIARQLKTTDFYRIRVGIAGEYYESTKQQGKPMAENYVLKPFSQEEKEQLPSIFQEIVSQLVTSVTK